MFTIEIHQHIKKPQAEVFAFMTDFANDAKWQADLVRSEQTSPGPMGIGSTGLYVQKFMGREMKNEAIVTAFEAPRLLGVKTTSGPVQFEYEVTLQEANGGTDITMRMKAEPGGFFKLAEGLVKQEAEKTLARDFARLQQILEG